MTPTPRDKNGAELRVGDRVTREFRVTEIQSNESGHWVTGQPTDDQSGYRRTYGYSASFALFDYEADAEDEPAAAEPAARDEPPWFALLLLAAICGGFFTLGLAIGPMIH